MLNIIAMNIFFNQHNIFARLLGFFMVFVYIGLGVIFLWVPVMWESFKGDTRNILGIALIIYGGFRAYRVYKVIKEDREEDE